MYQVVRPLLFRLEPETAHGLSLALMRIVGSLRPLGKLVQLSYRAPDHPVEAFGLKFRNPVGLAAGYDKDGLAWRGLAALGFGHIELGTVTPRPQPGNPKPRVFRLPHEQALINRMGFPGQGMDFVLGKIASRRPPGIILGINLGKNYDTPLDSAHLDYRTLYRAYASFVDYAVINISSPNTIGLRSLQAKHSLHNLLSEINQEKLAVSGETGNAPPILVKLSPDLTDQELDDALEVILDQGMDGVIATNTTLERIDNASPVSKEAGGLSGAPLARMSTEMILKIYKRTDGGIPIIGVGGIMTPADAREKLDAGAVLVQVYTGLVYTGPGLVKDILTSLT